MIAYKIKLRSGEFITAEDERDLPTLSKELCEQGFLQVERRISGYEPSKLVPVALMERAVESIEIA